MPTKLQYNRFLYYDYFTRNGFEINVRMYSSLVISLLLCNIEIGCLLLTAARWAAAMVRPIEMDGVTMLLRLASSQTDKVFTAVLPKPLVTASGIPAIAPKHCATIYRADFNNEHWPLTKKLTVTAGVAIVNPKVREICMIADEPKASSHIMLPQPRNKRIAVPKNSANSILHILLLSDTSSIAIIP
ncbi:hypothetical protein AGLY_010769, partial [Aphis glycines]